MNLDLNVFTWVLTSRVLVLIGAFYICYLRVLPKATNQRAVWVLERTFCSVSPLLNQINQIFLSSLRVLAS